MMLLSKPIRALVKHLKHNLRTVEDQSEAQGLNNKVKFHEVTGNPEESLD